MGARDDSRARWDERYRTGDWVDVDRPVELVAAVTAWLEPPGRVLDLACGAGRNALYLADRGFRVLAVDLSHEGLRRLAARARQRGLAVQPILADLNRFAVAPATFDVVVNTYFLLRSTFPLMREALRPGGVLVFETYHVEEIDALGGDIRREYALERGELLRSFGDFEILLHEEGVFERPEGERGLGRLIARKPAVAGGRRARSSPEGDVA